MGLFQLVKQNYGVGLFPDFPGKLSPLLVAHIAGRGAHQPGRGVGLPVFGHIEAKHGLLVPEQRLGQGLAQLGFPHAGGSAEEEGACGTAILPQPRPAAPDGGGHRPNRFLLADHPLVQDGFQIHQPFRLASAQGLHRDSRPLGHHPGHVLLPHQHGPGAGPPPVSGSLILILEVVRHVPQHGGPLEIHRGNRLVQLRLRLVHPPVQFLQLRRGDCRGQPHGGGGLVHQIHRLVRKLAVRQIPDGKIHRRLQRLVGDGQVMMELVPAAQDIEDLQRGFPGGRLHLHRLKPPLQGAVLLDIPAVFRPGGGADDLQLSPAQGGLQDI